MAMTLKVLLLGFVLSLVAAVPIGHHHGERVFAHGSQFRADPIGAGLGAPDIVTVAGGQVLGVQNASKNIRFWRGVPFGENTGGANRFLAPKPRAPWPGVYNATVYGHGCFSNHHGVDTAPDPSEDCLNLNIYVPYRESMQPGAKLPVIVFIYGGSFDEGDNEGPFEMYDGTYIASTRGVIIVTMNYRLGAFGFLVTDKIKGNMGLMDQNLALHWVQDNIHVFGGDKTQVTLWGESAGAMSIGTHILSPASKGLFSKAIMESHVSILYNNKFAGGLYGHDFCKEINCTSKGDNSCDTECMQKADPHVVITAWDKAAKNAIIYIEANWGHIADGLLSFIPTCCDDYVVAQTVDGLDRDLAPPIPVLIGSNTDEGVTFVYDGVPYLPMFLYEDAVRIIFGNHAQTIIDYYSQFHFVDGRAALSQVFTDYWFRCPSQKFITAAEKHGVKGYFYRYNHVLSAGAIFPKFGLPEACQTKVCHAAELPITFHHTKVPELNITLTAFENQLSDEIVDYWVSFARTGTPTGAVEWPALDLATRRNIVFANQTTVEDSTVLCSLWDSVGYNH
eukprot:m.225655 g.225655  ORF g.225655 m.225655 type:complete len:563 (+) comp16753_c0_seq1:46-1734(+)